MHLEGGTTAEQARDRGEVMLGADDITEARQEGRRLYNHVEYLGAILLETNGVKNVRWPSLSPQ